MMEYEFEGRTEREAIDAAVKALGLKRHEFEVERLDNQKNSFFQFNRHVRIRVYTTQDQTSTNQDPPVMERTADSDFYPEELETPETKQPLTTTPLTPKDDFEKQIIDFLQTIIEKLGFSAVPLISSRNTETLNVRLESTDANILIGKKGKTLDSLQLLVNAISKPHSQVNVVLDIEGYRARREENLIRLAHKIGDRVKQNRRSKLLDPMNAFERRIIHLTLNNIADIGTESEGEGLYKQVRIFYKGHQ